MFLQKALGWTGALGALGRARGRSEAGAGRGRVFVGRLSNFRSFLVNYLFSAW